MQKTKLKRTTALGLLAGAIYNSWPLGHWLNPRVAHDSLASGLEAVHQPYDWLFISTDVLSSILVIVLCYWLWRIYKIRSSYLRGSLYCFMLFAIGTTVDALLPERCVPNLMQCPNFTQDHYLLIHGMFSILASVFLFVALVILWLHKPKDIVLSVLLAGYVAFGLISLVQAITPG
ncbi:MAG: DUF998 domain-containing protein, partial [Candidatus Saccharimonadales bacterium]